MNKILIFIILFFSILSNSQIKFNSGENLFGLENHAVNRIHSVSPRKINKFKILYYINDKPVNQLLCFSLNSNNISKGHYGAKKVVNGIEYDDEVFIYTKNNYTPKEISLKEIKEKYSKDKGLPCQFFLDGAMLLDIEDNYTIDNNNILEINAFLYNNKIESHQFNVIEIFTKSDKNIKESKEICLD